MGRPEPDGRYTLAIVDRGVGMSAEAMGRLEPGRLAGQESFTVAPSKYLGHYGRGTWRPPRDRGAARP